MASSKDAATHQTKLDGICKIGEFERKRLKYFTPQIKVNSTHWEAFKTTLAKSNVENERVLAFFTKRIEVEERYCQHLAELPYSDLKGTGAWRRGGRKLQPPAPAPPSSSSLSSSSSAAATLTTATAAEATSTSTTPPSSSSSSLPAMDAMMASTDALVLKYQDYVRDTRKELLEGKLKALVTAFKSTSDEILLEGNHALDNVKVAEQHIVSAYLAYYKAYQALTLPQHQQQQQQQNSAAAGAAAAADMWLLDTQYRVAVELQKTIWQSTQQHLHDLFRRMKTLEVNRRSQIHALILRFMQNQGSFWAQLPQAAADCSVAISGLSSTDPNQVETELSEEIRRCAKAVEAREQHLQQQQQQHAAGRGTSSSSVGGGREGGSSTTTTTTPSSTPSVEPFTGHLLAPLDTPLVRRVEVLEHRLVTGVESLPLLKRWRPCLAVLTLDDFLHLFDLPSEVAPGTILTPREAFKLLIPSPIDKKGRFKKGKDVERVSPSLTFALPFSSARFRAEEGPEAFEIIEARQNTGFVSVFKAREITRVVLKARTQEKMVDWVVTVNHDKEKKEEEEQEKEKKEEKEQAKKEQEKKEEKETTATTAAAVPVAAESAEAVEAPVVAAAAAAEEEEREEAAPAPAVIAPLPVLEKEEGKEGGREGRDALDTPSPPPPPSPVREKEGGKEEEVGEGVESETPPLPLLVEQSKSSATVPESSSSSSSSSSSTA